MIHKELRDDVGYCVIPVDGLRQVFAVARPAARGDIAEQTVEALEAVHRIFKEHGCTEPVMQTIFLKNGEDLPACRRIVEEYFGAKMPATVLIEQPPCDGRLVAVESYGIKSSGICENGGVKYIDGRTVVVRQDGCQTAFLADFQDKTPGMIFGQSLHAFQAAGERLNDLGMHFDDVVRTWIYLGDITGMDGSACRYFELNRARTEFYRDRRFGANMALPPRNGRMFPASTGIGTGGRAMTLGCIAVRSERPDVFWAALENPRQTASCDYGRSYGPDSPKFARAMALVIGESVTTYISGTASITASETQHLDDAEWQTHQTLDNIEALISEKNFASHGLSGRGATLSDLATVRVYVKRTADYSAIETICRKRLGATPMICVLGDICRPELLVEIEGVAFRG